MHPNFKKYLANFLSGRQTYTEYNGEPSTTRHYINGVPQGSVLSTTLFNLYMYDIPAPTDPKTHLMLYASNLVVMSQHPKYQTAAANIQIYINHLGT